MHTYWQKSIWHTDVIGNTGLVFNSSQDLEKIKTFLEEDNKILGKMARNRIIDNYPIKRRKKAFEKCFIQNKL